MQIIKIILISILMPVISFSQVANDDCVTATPLTIPSSGVLCVNGTTVGAVSDNSTNACDTGPAGKEIWYTYVVTGSQNTVTVTPNASGGIQRATITFTTTPCSAASYNVCNTASTNNGTATTTWSAAIGTQVWFSIESNNGVEGGFQVCVNSTTPPPAPGNSCATATTLCDKSNFSVASFPDNASGFVPSCFGSALQRPIYYKFTVGQTGTLQWQASLLGTAEYDWALYDITSGCQGTAVQCNYNFTGTIFTAANSVAVGMTPGPGTCNGEFCDPVTVTAGNTYLLIIDNYSDNSVGFNFTWGGTFQMAPTSQFTISPTTACAPVNVTFNNTSVYGTDWDWNFGDGTTLNNTQNPPVKTYSSPGTYIISQTVTSAAGCVDIATQTLVVNPVPTVNAGVDQSVCAGTSVTLTATGTAGATFTWNNGATQGTAFTPASTQTYTATATLNGCTATDQALVTVNAIPTINAGAAQTVCAGSPVTLTATASAGATITWDNGVTNGVAFTPASTQTYTATATFNGCTATSTVVVTVNAMPTVNAGIDQTVCAGTAVTLTATGTAGATFTWDNSVTQSTAFTPLATQTYTVTAAIGTCTATDQAVVTVNAIPTINAGAAQTVCAGSPVTLTATASAGATITWDNGVTNGVAFTPASTQTYTATASFNGCSATSTVIVTVNAMPTVNAGLDLTICTGQAVTLTATNSAGSTISWTNGVNQGVSFIPPSTNTYTATATQNGCSVTDDVTITVNTGITVNAGADQTLCSGQSITLTGTGTVGAVYTWDNGVSDGVSFTPVGTQTYTLTGNLNGCISTDQVVVTIVPSITVNAGADQAVCPGSNVTLTATGTAGATFVWDNSVVNGASFVPLATNTYTVTASIGTCTATDLVTVTINAVPTVNAGLDQNICAGSTVTLNVTGSAGATFTWDNGVTDGVAFNPNTTTTYTATATLNGCTATDNLVINVNPLPVVNAGLDQAVCEGTSVTLNGSGATSYTWSGGVSNGIAFQPSAGVYLYSVSGTSNGCVGTDDVQITVNAAPVVSFSANKLQICEGQTIVLTNNSAISNNCVWNIEGMTAINGCGPISVLFPNAGLYDVSLTVTDNIGCQGSTLLSDMIEVIGSPTADFVVSQTDLSSSNPMIQFTNQSVNANTYSWTFGDGLGVSTEVNPNYSYAQNSTGSFTISLIAYNSIGCSDTTYKYVRIIEDLIYYVPNSFTPDDDEFNQGFKPIFTQGFDPYNYRLTIFNRWGETIFESNNAEIGWDGSFNQSGTVCKEGVYIWKIEFKIKDMDDRRVLTGHVNLIK